jgi:hypothetical protein
VQILQRDIGQMDAAAPMRIATERAKRDFDVLNAPPHK